MLIRFFPSFHPARPRSSLSTTRVYRRRHSQPYSFRLPQPLDLYQVLRSSFPRPLPLKLDKLARRRSLIPSFPPSFRATPHFHRCHSDGERRGRTRSPPVGASRSAVSRHPIEQRDVWNPSTGLDEEERELAARLADVTRVLRVGIVLWERTRRDLRPFADLWTWVRLAELARFERRKQPLRSIPSHALFFRRLARSSCSRPNLPTSLDHSGRLLRCSLPSPNRPPPSDPKRSCQGSQAPHPFRSSQAPPQDAPLNSHADHRRFSV
jgi:hypothetical protein